MERGNRGGKNIFIVIVLVVFVLFALVVLAALGVFAGHSKDVYSPNSGSGLSSNVSTSSSSLSANVSDQTSASSGESSSSVASSSASTTSSKRSGSVTTATQATTSGVIQLSNNNVEFIGRFLKTADGGYSFNWSGSTICAGFKGTEIGINITVSDGTTDYLNVTIDNNLPDMMTVTSDKRTYLLADGLKNSWHSVTIQKRTEGVQSSVLTFYGFNYLSGKPAYAPARKTRSIEFIGDSITAGYGNMGSYGASGFKLSQENAGKTYGALAAQALNADSTIIAISGAGMYQDLSGATDLILPKYYNQTLAKDFSVQAKWDFTKNVPNVTVINLGTNDFQSGVNSGDYYKAYMNFLASVRSNYPNTYIVCAMGPMSILAWQSVCDVVAARTAKGDRKIATCALTLDTSDTSLWGADGHPSAAGHVKLADKLAVLIREKLGW